MRAKPRRSKQLNVAADPVTGIWKIAGTIDGERIRKSLGTRDETTALRLAAQYQNDLWNRAISGDEAVRRFEEAAEHYMLHGGKNGTGGDARFLTPIIKHFRGRLVVSIKGPELREMANTLYPGKAQSTKNRQALVPARAVIIHAHHLGWCPPIIVGQFKVEKSRKHVPVSEDWLRAFMAEADHRKLPHLSALVLFMNRTATRISEAIRLTGKDVDYQERLVILGKTKTGEDETRYLTADVLARLQGLGAGDDERVFGYTDPKAPNRTIKRVCKAAKIPYRPTHSAGRHSFATNAMKAGVETKDAMDAGGWKSSRLFMETYVHSHQAGRRVAEALDRQRGPIDMNEANTSLPRRRKARKS